MAFLLSSPGGAWERAGPRHKRRESQHEKHYPTIANFHQPRLGLGTHGPAQLCFALRGAQAGLAGRPAIIEHYFQQALAKSSDNYPWFLAEYTQALEEMGKIEAAEEQYRKRIQLLRSEEKWREMGMRNFLDSYYASFLCRHGREQEAAEFSSSSCPPSAVTALGGEKVRRPWTASREAIPPGMGAGAEEQNGSGQPEAEIPSAPQQFPSLYIVEVPEKGE
jgi:hypothetical protein